MEKRSGKSGKRTSLRSIPGGKDGVVPPEARSPVLDFGAAREQRAQENRRRVERYFLDQVLDVFCEVAGRDQPIAVRLSEVSASGCSFSLGREDATALPTDAGGAYLPIEAKIYFSGDSFIRVGFKIVSLSPELSGQGRTMRVGCQLDPAFSASEAFIQFVRFVEAFCVHCGTDIKKAGSL